jgi:hypothetical protein
VFFGLHQYERSQGKSLVVPASRGMGDRDANARHREGCRVTDALRQFACALERSNALEPDLIVITGDIFDFDPSYIEEGCRALAELEALLGVWAVLGNHDTSTGAEKVADGLAKWTSIRLLRDSWALTDLDKQTAHAEVSTTFDESTIQAKLGGYLSPNKNVPNSAYPNPVQQKIAKSLIENDFRWHPRIRTPQDDGEGVLMLRDFATTSRRLVWMCLLPGQISLISFLQRL